MDQRREKRSDGIRDSDRTDILKLAQELDIHPDMLESELVSAAALLSASRENVCPADKKALRGLANPLRKAVERLSEKPVRERLVDATFQEPEDADEDGLNRYIASCEAKERVARALEGARDLLALIRAADTFRGEPGRPRDTHWTVAIASLVEFWIHDLGRDVTISGHPNDPRGVKPSPAVRFVQESMRLIGENVPQQTCRTILRNMRDRDFRPLDADV